MNRNTHFLLSAPVYVAPFTATSNISVIAIRWPNTFELNSVLLHYELTANGDRIYEGVNSFYMLRRTASLRKFYSLSAHIPISCSKTPNDGSI